MHEFIFSKYINETLFYQTFRILALEDESNVCDPCNIFFCSHISPIFFPSHNEYCRDRDRKNLIFRLIATSRLISSLLFVLSSC